MMRTVNSYPFYEITKRTLDVLVSVLGILVLSPVYFVVALLIKLDSEGPVILRQLRQGKDGKYFVFYKFRSMINDAERKRGQVYPPARFEGPIFKIDGDPRITRIGKALRRFSLDELPQLFNILKGDMSLVGPRPLVMIDVENPREPLLSEKGKIKYKIWKQKRLEVKPGLTGMWQVSGRSTLPLEGWIENDLYYVEHRSIWLDIEILFKTIPVALAGKGAV